MTDKQDIEYDGYLFAYIGNGIMISSLRFFSNEIDLGDFMQNDFGRLHTRSPSYTVDAYLRSHRVWQVSSKHEPCLLNKQERQRIMGI